MPAEARSIELKESLVPAPLIGTPRGLWPASASWPPVAPSRFVAALEAAQEAVSLLALVEGLTADSLAGLHG